MLTRINEASPIKDTKGLMFLRLYKEASIITCKDMK